MLHHIKNDAGCRVQVGVCVRLEFVVVSLIRAFLGEIHSSTDQNHRRGNDHSDAQQIPDYRFDTFVGPTFRILLFFHRPPFSRLELSRHALVDHLERHEGDDDTENNSQLTRIDFWKQAGSGERPKQHSDHHRHRNAGIDLTAA